MLPFSLRRYRILIPAAVFLILLLASYRHSSVLEEYEISAKENWDQLFGADHDAVAEEGDAARKGDEPGSCAALNFLKGSALVSKSNVTNAVLYSRRCIKPVFRPETDRRIVANVSEPLIGPQVLLDLKANDCSYYKLPPCDPVKLEVPLGYPQGEMFPHLVFGISTSYERLQKSTDTFAHWLAGRESRLVAVVTDYEKKNAKEIADLQNDFRIRNVNITLEPPLESEFTTEQSHFTSLVYMVHYAPPEAQWFGLLDDDTFFPHLKPLSEALGRLNYTHDLYVGTLSEDFETVRRYGYMAYGGAGSYLSAPLARRLGEEEMAMKCINEASGREGDVILRDCVYRQTNAKMTPLKGLFQADFMTDASGFFESGVQPLNLHHWKSWFNEPVTKMAAATDFCGDCFLQRWRFGNDTIFSNGYSIAKYRDGIEDIDLNQMEGTWRAYLPWIDDWVPADQTGQFDFSIGPLRKKFTGDEKKSYKLVDAEIDGRGTLRQLYVWKGNKTLGEMDEVAELIWQP